MGIRSPDTGVRSRSVSVVDAVGGPERTNEVSNPHLPATFLNQAKNRYHPSKIKHKQVLKIKKMQKTVDLKILLK